MTTYCAREELEGCDIYEPKGDRNSACRRWIRSMGDPKMMLPVVYRWCCTLSMPGMSAEDQIAYIICVFAFGDIDVRLRTGTGVSLFGPSPRILDLLFGETESIERSLRVSAASKRKHLFRRYKGVMPSTEKFNIPYECMSDRFMECLYHVLGRQRVFGAIKLNTVNGDHLKEKFRWNRLVHHESPRMRVNIIHWYVSLSMLVHAAHSESLASIIGTLCDAMKRVETTLYIYERVYDTPVQEKVKDYLSRFNRALGNYGARSALYRSVRASVADRYMEKLSSLYYEKTVEEVIDMFVGATATDDREDHFASSSTF